MTEQRLEVETIDYHTGGEPFRIIVGGVPVPEGATILARRRSSTVLPRNGSTPPVTIRNGSPPVW